MRLKIFCIFLLTAFVCFKMYDRQSVTKIDPILLDEAVRNATVNTKVEQQILEDAQRQLPKPQHN